AGGAAPRERRRPGREDHGTVKLRGPGTAVIIRPPRQANGSSRSCGLPLCDRHAGWYTRVRRPRLRWAGMSDATPGPPSADRNLLFGILALQLDFVSRDALVAAMNAWVLR